MQPDPSLIRKAVDLPAVYVEFVKIALKTFHCIPCCKFFFLIQYIFINTKQLYILTSSPHTLRLFLLRNNLFLRFLNTYVASGSCPFTRLTHTFIQATVNICKLVV